jgi:hypothetical protein
MVTTCLAFHHISASANDINRFSRRARGEEGKNLRRLNDSVEIDDYQRVWNFIVPSQEKKDYSPIQFIPLLNKKSLPTGHSEAEPKR